MAINKEKNHKENSFLAKVDEVNPAKMSDLQALKNELKEKLYIYSKARLYNRIYATLKKDPKAIKTDKENRLRIRQLVIAIKKVDDLIIENRNIVLSQQKARLNKGKK